MTKDQAYDFTYYYGNGDSYSGYGFADTGTYTAGQYVYSTPAGSSFYTEIGTYGYYYIDYVEELGYDNGLPGKVFVNAYYDAGYDYDGVDSPIFDTAYSAWGTGYNGLGSESGNAWNDWYNNSDASFSSYDSADLKSNAPIISEAYGFTYYYGNGDSYSGYVYADTGTYTAGQYVYSTPAGSSFYTEIGTYGYYYIDDVYELYTDDFGYLEGSVFVHSYYDAGYDDDGVGSPIFGTAYFAEGTGYNGLGSESGVALNIRESSIDSRFTSFDSADLAVKSITNDSYYEFTYYYGNGDSYSGYGYDDTGTHFAGQYVYSNFWSPHFATESGTYGYYYISSVLDLGYDTGLQCDVYITSYYDAGYNDDNVDGPGFGTTYNIDASGETGLGSEYGYAYNNIGSNSGSFFSSYTSADLSSLSYYSYTYYYGNGDSYSGYGYANTGTYTAGQYVYSTPADYNLYNESGNYGYYYIDYIYDYGYNYGTQDEVYITSYFDGGYDYDGLSTPSFGAAYSAEGSGSGGLGSEVGTAFNSGYNNSDAYVSNYYSADLSSTYTSYYSYTYYYGNGDSYSGYGYATTGTYTAGQYVYSTPAGSSFYTEIGTYGYYYIDYVDEAYDDFGYRQGRVFVNSYYDAGYDDDGVGSPIFGTASTAQGTGYNGLGSESGVASNLRGSSIDSRFTNFDSADLAVKSITNDSYYEFTYYYGNGDSYSGYGYADTGTYFAGQYVYSNFWRPYFATESGTYGYFIISSVFDLGYDTGLQCDVHITSYYDAVDDDNVDGPGFGTTYNIDASGETGLGMESGYAYNNIGSNSGSFFDSYTSADLGSLSYYSYTYYYGNGDSYSGYGYANTGTYTAGQYVYSTPADYNLYNESGNYGYYYIDYTNDYGYDYDYDYVIQDWVEITSYYDGGYDYDGLGAPSFGTAYYARGSGSGGLGSEVGTAFNSGYNNSDAYVSNYYSADLSSTYTSYYSYTYYYGNGDSYSGYGYANTGTYTAGQYVYSTPADYNLYNESGNYGYYYIDYIYDYGYNYVTQDEVYITSYFDGGYDYDGLGAPSFGTAYSAWGSGSGGLGSESGYAYNSGYTNSDSYFTTYASADLITVEQVVMSTSLDPVTGQAAPSGAISPAIAALETDSFQSLSETSFSATIEDSSAQRYFEAFSDFAVPELSDLSAETSSASSIAIISQGLSLPKTLELHTITSNVL